MQLRLIAAALAVSCLAVPTGALAQVSEEGDHEELPPGHPGRTGSYAWGEGGEVASDAPASAADHRYARVFLSAGAGLTIRTLIYVDSLHHDPSGLAPPYLQLRGVYFFEGDGLVQHGVGLGVATNLTGEGLFGVVNEGACNASGRTDPVACTPAGLDGFAAWTFVPGYHARFWFDDWFQLIARVGVGVTAAELVNAGFELGVSGVLKFLAGLGLYVEAAFSTYFAADAHPLISVEGGFVFDYELLP